MDRSDRREMYNGFGDTLARAVELTLTPAIFGFLGWWLDHRVGTTPVFTLLFTLVVFGYGCWKLWSGYETSMRSHEERLDARLGRRG